MCIGTDDEYPHGEHVGHKPSGSFFCHPHPHASGEGRRYNRATPNPECDYCQRVAAWWNSGIAMQRYVDGIKRVTA